MNKQPVLKSTTKAQAPPKQVYITKTLTAFGAIGKEVTPLTGGREAELLHHAGNGCLTHMWFGGTFPDYGLTRIRVYVDGETAASIDMEMLLGIGVGFQDDAAPWSIARMGKTGRPSGIYNTFRAYSYKVTSTKKVTATSGSTSKNAVMTVTN